MFLANNNTMHLLECRGRIAFDERVGKDIKDGWLTVENLFTDLVILVLYRIGLCSKSNGLFDFGIEIAHLRAPRSG